MAINPWFRMYGEFATDPKVQRLSEADQRRYVMLLCLRCSNGDVTLHDDDIAFQLRISDEEWAATRQRLLAKNLINENNQPTAWGKRQYASDSSAERVRKHRQNKKKAKEGDVTLQQRPANAVDTDTDTESEGKQPLSESSTVGGSSDKPVPPSASPPPGDLSSEGNGTRLPDDWVLPKAWGDEALQIRPDLSAADVRREGEQFRDHWHSQPGKLGVKTNWLAVWRKWIRSDKTQPGKARAGGGAKGAVSSPWFMAATGIEAKAIELKIAKEPGEHWQSFRDRVYVKAGVTPEMLRQAKIDAGERPS